MKRRSKVIKLAVLLLPCSAITGQMRADEGRDLTQQHPAMAPISRSDAALMAHLELTRIWRLKFERNIAPDLMRLLGDERFMVRYNAAIFLSHLDYAQAEEPVRVFLERPSEKIELDKVQRRLQLQLALARIRARDLKGEAKVEAVAASIGRSLTILLPQQVQMPAFGEVSADEVIQREFFELLYSMAKRGENIEGIRRKLHFSGDYKLLLDSASLPQGEEVAHVLNRLQEQGGSSSGYLMLSYLPRMSRGGFDVLLKWLQDMREHPERHFKLLPLTSRDIHHAEASEKLAAELGVKRDLSYLRRPHYASGYSSLFYAAALSDDARFLPVLKQLEEKFATDPDFRVRDDAISAQEMLQRRLRLLQTLDEPATAPPK